MRIPVVENWNLIAEIISDQQDKRSAVNLSPQSGLTPAMKKMKLNGVSDQDEKVCFCGERLFRQLFAYPFGLLT